MDNQFYEVETSMNQLDTDERVRDLLILGVPPDKAKQVVSSIKRSTAPMRYDWMWISSYIVIITLALFIIYLYSNLDSVNKRIDGLSYASQTISNDLETPDPIYPTEPLVAELNVDGGVDRQIAKVGEAINYSYLIANTGNVTLTKFIIIDNLNTMQVLDFVLAPNSGITTPLTTNHTVTHFDLPGPLVNQIKVLGISSIGTVGLSSTREITNELAAIDLNISLYTDVFTVTQPISVIFSIKNTGTVNVRPNSIRYPNVNYPIRNDGLEPGAIYSNTLPLSVAEPGPQEYEIEVSAEAGTNIIITDSEKIKFIVAVP